MWDWLIWLASGAALLVLFVLLARAGLRRFRYKRLLARFEQAEMVDAIMEGRIALGMTADMVRATWGEPADLDETVTRTRVRQQMKYNQTGKNRFGTRVDLEDGVVIGWETK